MNILFVHEVDWLRKVVYEIHTLSELLSLSGHNVYAIDYEAMWERDGHLWSPKTEHKVARAYTGASVNLIRPCFVKIPVLSRMAAFVSHYFEIRDAIREKNIDIIILYSVPTNGLQTVSLAKKFCVPVVFRSIDVLNRLVRKPFLSKMTYVMERMVYPKVDMVLTISPMLSRYVVKMGASEERVRLLPLGIDLKLFHPTHIDGLREAWGFNEKDKIIVFVGTLPCFSGLDALIGDLPRILREVPEAKLLVVGDGLQRSSLEKIILRNGLQGAVRITGLQSQGMVAQFINMADVCVNPFPIVGATRDIFPTKVIQYMACGKPTVSMPLPGLMQMVGEGNGVLYADGGMASGLIGLLNCKGDREQMGRAALKYVSDNHSYTNIVKRFEELVQEVI